MTRWFDKAICVPFGNKNFDSAYGGSHDMDVQTTPNEPITSIVSGHLTALTAPSWGKMVCLKLDNPVNGVAYFAYLHLSAINPALAPGQHVDENTLIGWAGGCTNASQYDGTSNPTGSNFLNATSQSSQPQTGIALMRGPIYGSGPGWATFPPIDKTLDPTPILNAARATPPPVPVVPFDYQGHAIQVMWSYLGNGDYTSGIAEDWQKNTEAGVFYGPPLGGEKDSTTDLGAKIKLQVFAGGWVEWHEDETDGPFGAHWYRYN